MSDRAAFEKWVTPRYGFELTRTEDGYRDFAINDEWEAWRAGMRAGIERAAEVCDDRAIVYDGLEDAASTRYFADKMRGAREGSEQCAAAIRALVEGKP